MWCLGRTSQLYYQNNTNFILTMHLPYQNSTQHERKWLRLNKATDMSVGFSLQKANFQYLWQLRYKETLALLTRLHKEI